MEVGGAFVRIRPYVADEDVRALESFHQLAKDICSAFDRFYEATEKRDTAGDVIDLGIAQSRTAAPPAAGADTDTHLEKETPDAA